MRMNPDIRRLAAILLLFCLPLQAMGALLLPCAVDTPATVSCHSVASADEEPVDGNLLQCHTCALSLLSYSGIAASRMAEESLPNVVMAPEFLSTHYHSHTPDPLQRPPLAL